MIISRSCLDVKNRLKFANKTDMMISKNKAKKICHVLNKKCHSYLNKYMNEFKEKLINLAKLKIKDILGRKKLYIPSMIAFDYRYEKSNVKSYCNSSYKYLPIYLGVLDNYFKCKYKYKLKNKTQHRILGMKPVYTIYKDYAKIDVNLLNKLVDNMPPVIHGKLIYEWHVFNYKNTLQHRRHIALVMNPDLFSKLNKKIEKFDKEFQLELNNKINTLSKKYNEKKINFLS
jgi:hypothetical protein